MEGMISQLKPPGLGYVVFSRRDVARTEIVQAIRLYLERDFISAHLLASAATEILHALRTRAHKTTSLADLETKLRQFMTPAEVAETMSFVKLPYNFMKHSGSDPDLQMHFRPGLVEVGVYHAIHDFEAVFADRTPEMLMFQTWFMARHPGSFIHLPADAQQKLQDMDLAAASDAEAFAFGRDMLARA
jgi:hypothetical protein